jgi:hypothetical protein
MNNDFKWHEPYWLEKMRNFEAGNGSLPVTSCCKSFSYVDAFIEGTNKPVIYCTYCNNPTALIEATKEEIAKHWD